MVHTRCPVHGPASEQDPACPLCERVRDGQRTTSWLISVGRRIGGGWDSAVTATLDPKKIVLPPPGPQRRTGKDRTRWSPRASERGDTLRTVTPLGPWAIELRLRKTLRKVQGKCGPITLGVFSIEKQRNGYPHAHGLVVWGDSATEKAEAFRRFWAACFGVEVEVEPVRVPHRAVAYLLKGEEADARGLIFWPETERRWHVAS